MNIETFLLSLPFLIYFCIQLQNFINESTDHFTMKEIDDEKIDDEKIDEEKKDKKEVNYEEKYMEKLYKMKSEFIFTGEEELLNDQYELKKELIRPNVVALEKEIEEIEQLNSNESLLDNALNKIKKLEDDLKYSICEKIRQNIINERNKNIKNCFVMEKTPLGNVVMYYNADRETFEYYSDSTIPYRFLEVVARKYVTTFNCPYLYIMMTEELQKYEKKLEEQQEKKRLEEEHQKQTPIQNENQGQNKKNVFAKFKSYNKEAGSGRVNKAPPPKNSIPNNSKINENDKVILKENANRYTYEGRFSNFSPLKKIERKKVDKKYAMTFADFKKMQKNENEK